MREVVGGFLSSVGAELASLRAAARASNAADVWRIAHKLKGSCALLGVVRMTAVLQGVEACGRGGKLETAGSAVEQLDRELALVRPALEAELRS